MKILYTVLAVTMLVPSIALAHAIPLESSPASSALVESAPAEVHIRFSERIDEAASRIIVRAPDGVVVSGDASVSLDDPRTLSVAMESGIVGAYTVEWGVVSRDDGHFTRGSYAFAVGDATLELPPVAQAEMVQIATTPEIIGSTVELFGHGLLWAILILFAIGIRPYYASGRALVSAQTLARLYLAGTSFAVTLVAIGGGTQIWFKARDLAGLQSAAFLDALESYIGTTAGEATVLRLVAAAVILVVVLLARHRIVQSVRFTSFEWAFGALLLLYAWQRGAISHATANYFYPDFSIIINTLHLIEKDIWAGVLFVLFACFAYSPTRELAHSLAPQAYKLLSWNLVGITLTGSYVVWLHLRDFGNITTTAWGIEFVGLLVVSLALIFVRMTSVALCVYAPVRFHASQLKLLMVELVLALCVIYASCAVIITSPPQQDAPTPTYQERSEGAKLSLEVHPYRDGYLRLQVDSDFGAAEPFARIASSEAAAMDVALEKQYPGSYAFPLVLLRPDTEYTLHVSVPQEQAYDAAVTFEIPAGAFDASAYSDVKRRFDAFTFAMLLIAAFGAALFAALAIHARRIQQNPDRITRIDSLSVTEAVAVGLVVLVAVAATWRLVPLLHTYKSLCLYDGNMWHVMLPMKEGVPESITPREGCMWGMGAYQYMFADKSEYQHYRDLPPARASVEFASSPVVGESSHFTVTFRSEDGSVPPLFMDMEKRVHVVIVSRDQTVFAHIHPDDTRELSEDEIRTAQFKLEYAFPKAGEYLISVDYANGITLESHQEKVLVQGEVHQDTRVAQYQMPREIGPFTVALEYSQPFAGEVATFVYKVNRDGRPAELEPYLSAAMHIAVVKNDLDVFAHLHGEVYPPGTEIPPTIVRNGRVVHSMAAMYTPPKFDYPIDAHVIFPQPGLYTVWAQFQSEGEVYAVPATVRVE